MFYNIKNKAFTLVELVIVIVIISILATIGFISFQGYSSQARDSVRITDLKNIQKSLDFKLVKGGSLIEPDNKSSEKITKYGLSWEVGSFGENNFEEIGTLSNLPVDPSTKLAYSYLYNKNYDYYILETDLEKGEKFTLSNYAGIKETFTDESCFLYEEKNDGSLIITGLKDECDNVKDLKIPYEIDGKPVKEIGGNFLWYNYYVKTVYGPSIEKILSYAITDSNLVEINFPNLLEVENHGLSNNKLEKLYLPKLRITGLDSFAYNKIKELNLPELRIAGYSSFLGNSIVSIELPKLEEIERDAFHGANAVKRLDFPELTKIGPYSFEAFDSIEYLNVPKLKEIGEPNTGIDFNIDVLDLGLIEKLKSLYIRGNINELRFSKLKRIENGVEIHAKKIIFPETLEYIYPSTRISGVQEIVNNSSFTEEEIKYYIGDYYWEGVIKYNGECRNSGCDNP